MTTPLHSRTALELARTIRERSASATEVVQSCLASIERSESKLHAFLSLNKEAALAGAREVDANIAAGKTCGILAGVPIAVKDNICTTDFRTTCASRMLETFLPPYDAHVISCLRQAGAIIIGKTNLDEFAMGSSTENSAFGPTRNPWDLARAPGGSSGGSAAAVAADMAPVSLGSDTGGSIRQPAAFCGLVGLKPTYGLVSRYGLVAFASSLDQIGPITKDVRDAAMLLDVIASHDMRDSTCVDRPRPKYLEACDQPMGRVRVGVPKEYFGEGLDPEIAAAVMAAVKTLEKLGAEVKEISLPHTRYAVSTYYIIAPAEASSNLARYDGVHYGFRAEGCRDIISLFSASRAKGLGPEVQRRILLGTYVLSSGYYDAFYLKAARVRHLIQHDFDAAFGQVDCIVSPASPCAAFPLGARTANPLEMYLADIYTLAANLAGIPGISIPCGFTRAGLPIGLQIMAGMFEEPRLLQVAAAYERETNWRSARRPE